MILGVEQPGLELNRALERLASPDLPS